MYIYRFEEFFCFVKICCWKHLSLLLFIFLIKNESDLIRILLVFLSLGFWNSMLNGGGLSSFFLFWLVWPCVFPIVVWDEPSFWVVVESFRFSWDGEFISLAARMVPLFLFLKSDVKFLVFVLSNSAVFVIFASTAYLFPVWML